MTLLGFLLALFLVRALWVFAWRRPLPRALLGTSAAGALAALLAFAMDAPLASLGLASVLLVVALALVASHVRHRGRAGAPAERPSWPGLVVAAFILVPWLALVAGVLSEEDAARSASSASEVSSLDELISGLVALAALAALLTLTANARGDER
jgi:hypothetical protein